MYNIYKRLSIIQGIICRYH